MSKSSSPLPKKILFPTDGSYNAQRAEAMAVNIAKASGAEIVLLNVQTKIPRITESDQLEMATKGYTAVIEKQARQMIDDLVTRAAAKGVKARGDVEMEVDSVVETIVDAAIKEKADMIVMGTRGAGGFQKMPLGSVAKGVLDHARCAVMIVK